MLRGAREALAYARGESSKGFVAHVPDEVDVAAVRSMMGLSQEAFAQRFGFTVGAVRDWEQKRRTPERAARVLLTIIAREPDAVSRALNAK
jgi:putative transcriptional regulator